MFFWFIGCSALIVWNVFRDPGIDYRLLALGSLLPDAVDAVIRHRLVHSLTVCVCVLAAITVGTVGRRAIRRRLLMVPIGMLIHLVLDGVFQSTRTFWWPASGLSIVTGPIPSLQRTVGLNAVFELVGLLVLRWFWRRFQLGGSVARRAFWSTGHLPIP